MMLIYKLKSYDSKYLNIILFYYYALFNERTYRFCAYVLDGVG